MPDTEQAFLTEMALQLEATIRQLEEREAQLAALLGLPRVEELKELWAKQLDLLDEKELKANMDWTDKELIWVWSRLERARDRRVRAGRTSMLVRQYGRDAANEPEHNK